ncbi:MAG: protein kinase [Deltaproteobacteria bacterium]|jgi:hypothetical protein|nr:protein kinase [Deltaproteobacteria bacterium]
MAEEGARDTDLEGLPAARTAADLRREGTPRAAGGGPGQARRAALFGLRSFLGYPVDRVLSSAGGEADIYVIRDGEGREYVLRLFRQGREPKPEIFGLLTGLSASLGPLVCATYRTGLDEATGRWYEIQEYLPLGDLAGYFARGPLGPQAFRELALQLSRCLEALHREGLVHRDVKPDNILLRRLDPVAVALADFGISSLLAPGVSVKETRAANTPLYSAPESFADFAGEAGDWWSLGAVLLEGVLGRHPLAGLSVNQVMREISLRGLAVPAGVGPAESELLKGLLTRDDRRRWGAREVSRWLAGERGIAVYYEEPAAAPRGSSAKEAGGPGERRPYRFRGREYRSSAELAEAFARSEEDWTIGREHLMRGYLRSHYEETGRREGARLLSRIESMGLSPDEMLFAFVQNFRARARHVWRGLPVSRKAVLDLLEAWPAAGAAPRGPGAEAPAGAAASAPGKAQGPRQAGEEFLEEILAGRLGALPDIARKAGHPLDKVMEALFAFGRPVSRGTLLSALDASLCPEAFVWGFLETPPVGPEPLSFALHSGAALLSWTSFWKAVPRRAVLPREIPEKLSEPATYDEGLRLLALLSSTGTLSALAGRKFPGLAPWKAASGRVHLTHIGAEELMDMAEDMKERGQGPGPPAWEGFPPPRQGFPPPRRPAPGQGEGGSGGGAASGPGGAGDPGTLPDEDSGQFVGGWGGRVDAAIRDSYRGLLEWLRRELDPFEEESFLSVNLVPAVLALSVSALWLFLWKEHQAAPPGGRLNFGFSGVMSYLMCIAGAALSSYLVVRALAERLRPVAFLAPPFLLSVFIIPLGSAYFLAKMTVAWLLCLYFINRLRHRLRARAAGVD